MVQQPYNCTISIYEQAPQAPDNIGGAVLVSALRKERVRAHLVSLSPSKMNLEVGIQVTRLYNLAVWPGDVPLDENDLVIPESGAWKGLTFLVIGVQRSGMRTNSIRARKTATLQRVDFQRSVQ